MKQILHIVAMVFALLMWQSATAKESVAPEERVQLADPFILLHDGVYYAYGTHNRNGIEFYTSNDLKKWHYGGVALHKNDSYGNKWFWAPEVYHINGKFYMYYTAEKHICVATSSSPTGPFVQQVQEPMLPDSNIIDNTLFIDDDGTPYLLYVVINKGFTIYAAELDSDLTTIKPNTATPCIRPRQRWEKLEGKVNEGPSVIKYKGRYFLLYSGNGYHSQMYGIGCAVADNIRGPWKKLPDNPILQLPSGLYGTGHGAPFYDKKGNMYYVFHAHNNSEKVHPRYMAITRMAIKRSGKGYRPVISSKYFVPKTKK